MKHIDKEYCLPFDSSNPEFWMRIEHLGRYIYAADFISKRSIKRVLDAACADGYGCREMAKSGAQVYGVDYNARLIKKAERQSSQFKNIKFIMGDLNIESLSGFGEMDLVTCFDTLEHLKDPEKFLFKINSALVRFGTLLLSVPKAEFEPMDENGLPTNEYHLHRFSRQDIEALLEKTGFCVEKALHQPFTNLCMSLEKNAIRDTGTSLEKVRSFYGETKEALRFFARAYALPVPLMEENSYSIFIVASKQ